MNKSVKKQNYEIQRKSYDFALSYASEDREIVKKIATRLKRNHTRVFFDEFQKTNLWAKNIYLELFQIYSEKSLFCIIFFSKHYKTKYWTNHESKAAILRMLKDRNEYIFPVILDDSKIPKELSSLFYIRLKDVSFNQIIDTLIRKLQEYYHSIGWLSEEEAEEYFNKAVFLDAIVKEFIDKIQKEKKGERSLTIVILCLIYLIQDDLKKEHKEFINFLLVNHKTINKYFKADKFYLSKSREHVIQRTSSKEGELVLALNKNYIKKVFLRHKKRLGY